MSFFNLVFLLPGLMAAPVNTGLHDFHLSKAEIHFNAESQSLEISLHLFIDDLELAIRNQGMANPYISTSKETANADSLISVYLNQHFKIEVDGKLVNLHFLGKENSDDLLAIWCYLEGEQIADPRTIKLQNRLLVELFDDQKNIVAFRSARKKEFLLFDARKLEATIVLQ